MVVEIIMAARFGALGAVVAGGAVVSTIKSGVINPAHIGDSMTFVWLMMAALLAGALWLNLATWMGAPVSTTHSIVGGVLGAGVAAAGWDVANRSEEHTSELQSLMRISYAVLCLKKKKTSRSVT